MGTAYIFFGKPITPDTVALLITAFRTLGAERDDNKNFLWDHLHLSIACGGGDVIAGLGIFNELVAMPLTITTHNSSAVDSAAIMPFLLGQKRTASAKSAFYFHHFQWTFTTNINQNRTSMWEASKWLTTYEDIVATMLAERTQIQRSDALQLM